jgi:PKD repeat protein
MKKLLTLAFSFMFLVISAQKWVGKMMDPTVNFYEVKSSFDKYWKREGREREREREREKKEKEKKGEVSPSRKGMPQEEEEGEDESFMIYKRWENFMAPRVYPSGDRSLVANAPLLYDEFLQSQSTQRNAGPQQTMSSTWTAVGPMGAPSGGNAGRLNVIRFHPTNSNIIYACAPAGGLWVSTNGGTSWTTATDQLAVIGCSDLAIDPTNPLVMYLATGDGDAGDTPSIGLLKSTDGGNTWNATGLSFAASAGTTIRRIKINPNNTQQILVGTNTGVYRSTNGGSTFGAAVITSSIRDMELNPLNPNEVFVSGTRFYRSRNFGQSFTQITSGLPSNTVIDRMAIAVTPADTSYIYAIAGDASTSGSYGFYVSTNSGTSFSQVTFSSPANLLGWSSTGNDASAGGQSWYDLAIAVSPTDKNEVVVGGVNVWRTTNGGSAWTIYGHWTGSGAPFIHADIHDLSYNSAGTLYATCDGGVFRRGASSWTDLSAAMNIAQPYKIGLSTSSSTLMITGHQDNGTNKYNGAWAEVMGGDGMDCFIDRTNNNVMYGEQYNGSLNRSTNGGANWTGITTGLSGNAAWVTPWHQDPTVANTIYVGYDQLFVSTNQGTNWTQTTGTMTGSSSIVEFAIAPSNNQVIYVIKGNTLFKTTNAGGAWTSVTTGLPTASVQMTNLAIDPTDPNNVWVTFSGYSSANKVFVTTNGGTNWTNVSTGLPNLPVNCIVYTPGSTTDALYVGCDVGVYYKDNSSSWTSYNTGLPNVPVFDLEIYQPLGKIRAATFGRSVWEVDIFNPGNLAPIASFASDRQVVCAGQTVNYTDQSSFTPTSWSWSFQGGTPSTSTSQNPAVVYNTPGTYSVSLTATNANGNNTATQTNYINVTSVYSLPLAEDFASTSFPPTNWTTKDVNNDGLFWTRNSSVGSQGTTTCMMFDNYNLDAAGTRDEMQAPRYNMSGLTSATLTFDVAYRQYDNQYSDTLAVLVSTDCGITFTTVYSKGGATLASVAGTYTTALFAPASASEWRAETVNMNAYAGQPNVMVVFQNRGRYGQGLYIDKINLTGVTAGAPPTASFTASSNTCTNQNISFTDGSTNTPTSWSWTFPGGNPSSSTLQNPTVSYATAGTYTVTHTATNANGTSTPVTQTFTINTTPVASASTTGNPFCSGSTITLNSSGGSAYQWTGPGTYTSAVQNPTRNNATLGMAGTYTVTVTSNGCSATATTVVNVNLRPTAVISPGANSFCAGSGINLITPSSSAGSGTITGYQWQLNGSPISGATASSYSATAAGTYNVIITNSNGCSTTSANRVLTVNAAPVASVTGANGFCAGGSTVLDASSSAAGSGTISSYQWQLSGSAISGATGTTYTASAGGNYSVVVTNSNTCSTTSSVLAVVVYPNPSALSLSSTSSTCGASNGVISVNTTTGGTSPYTYSIDGGSFGTANGFNGLPAATHTVTVQDVNGCLLSDTISLMNVGGPDSVTLSATDEHCSGSDGSITIVTVTGGTAPFQYSLNGGVFQTTTFFTGMGPGTYTIMTKDANGCSVPGTVTISTIPGPPTPTISQNGLMLSSSASSGNQWYLNGTLLPGETNQSITVTQNGDYTVVVTDAFNCSSTSAITQISNVGISETDLVRELKIFPNPSNGVFEVKMNLPEKADYTLEISSELGQLMHKETIRSNSGIYTRSFNFSKEGAAVYYLTISDGKEKIMRKIVVN